MAVGGGVSKQQGVREAAVPLAAHGLECRGADAGLGHERHIEPAHPWTSGSVLLVSATAPFRTALSTMIMLPWRVSMRA
jgi:hypothetical protein